MKPKKRRSAWAKAGGAPPSRMRSRTRVTPVPEARWGWGPIALRFAPWLSVDSVQFLDSVHSESDLLRWARGRSPRRETDEMKPARRAGFLVGEGAKPPQGDNRDEASSRELAFSIHSMTLSSGCDLVKRPSCWIPVGL